MDRYVCIHAHLYQPPRENPWLEFVEIQDSAYPYHDWNERITAECYAPNGCSRVLDGDGRIASIVNNYSRISFNFGPTLLSWLEAKSPETYRSILHADQQSAERFDGHGSAMAQAYNHMILPLANGRDKFTQVYWGLRDFEYRFGRKPEGMWLAETAVDLESLDIMAQLGIKFTVLSPFQAARVRKMKQGSRWKDVNGGRVDPSQPYLVRLNEGRSIALFFYDGPISQGVAFEKLLNSGEQFAHRLMSGFSDSRKRTQLVHIATDGESYGHHHPHGDMALAYALEYLEREGLAKLTNYGEFLEKFPPTMEAQIHERSAWSCSHGVGRWMADCGCNSGGHPEWNQQWRGPLRNALDWLRDTVAPLYEGEGTRLFQDAWRARNGYIRVVLDRAPKSLDRFFAENSRHELLADDRIRALKLLEMQRHAMLMYTSCGWFFDEISGLETVQVIQYAARVVQLAQELFGNEDIEKAFLDLLQHAKSNIPEHRDGAEIYRKWVKPTMISLEQVAAHWAIASAFETGPAIYCYTVTPHEYQTTASGKSHLALGRARVCSRITTECAEVAFAVFHRGDYNLRAGVNLIHDISAFQEASRAALDLFKRGEIAKAQKRMTQYFGELTYSLRSLFRDEQRRIVERIREKTRREVEGTFRQLFEKHSGIARQIRELGLPAPKPLVWTADFVVHTSLRQALQAEHMDARVLRHWIDEAQKQGVQLDTAGLSFDFSRYLGRAMEELSRDPSDRTLLFEIESAVELLPSLPFAVNLWRTQNIYYSAAQQKLAEIGTASKGESPSEAAEWVDRFFDIGRRIGIRVEEFQRPTAAEEEPELAHAG